MIDKPSFDSRPVCPECAGTWLGSFRFDHLAGCGIGQAQDRTRQVDAANLRRFRPATDAELQLAEGAFGHPVVPEAVFRQALAPVPRSTSVMTEVVDATATVLIVGGYDPGVVLDNLGEVEP